MGVRAYTFVSGPETPTLPSISDPSASTDLISKGYADKSYARGVADLTALKAIGSSDRTDNLPIFVDSLGVWFYFDAASSATGNDITVITPTAGTGRWLLVQKAQSFAIANNQSSSANVTPLLFDKTKIRSVEIRYQIFRAATGKVAERGILLLVNDDTNWDYAIMGKVGESGVVFTCNSSGQVQYTSDNMAGSYDTTNSVMKYTVHPTEL